MTEEKLESLLRPLLPINRTEVMDYMKYLIENNTYLLSKNRESSNKLKTIREVLE